jgi:hypothetical protein
MVEIDAESFKSVMHSLSLFIDKVHNSPYDPALVRRESYQRIFRLVPNPSPQT